MAKLYGLSRLGVFADRVTFVIGKDGRIQSTTEGSDALDPSRSLSACTLPRR